MSTLETIQQLLSSQLGGGSYPADSFSPTTGLIGEIPEFDSMAVVSVLTAIEDNFGVEVPDDEISADIFETVGTLVTFVDTIVSDAG